MAVVSNGTTLIDNGALDSAVPSGKLTLLSTQTASSSATLEFTSGIDSTYDSYVFKFINIHSQNNIVDFQLNFRDGGASFDAVKTTTAFRAYHNEADTDTTLGYVGAFDVAQGTGVHILANNMGNDNDQNLSGALYLYNPSSTTFVKHFIADLNNYNEDNYSVRHFSAGYCNTTSAIDGIQFKCSSGNIDDGIIKMYGVG